MRMDVHWLNGDKTYVNDITKNETETSDLIKSVRKCWRVYVLKSFERIKCWNSILH